jgi:hypothetical protein
MHNRGRYRRCSISVRFTLQFIFFLAVITLSATGALALQRRVHS